MVSNHSSAMSWARMNSCSWCFSSRLPGRIAAQNLPWQRAPHTPQAETTDCLVCRPCGGHISRVRRRAHFESPVLFRRLPCCQSSMELNTITRCACLVEKKASECHQPVQGLAESFAGQVFGFEARGKGDGGVQ